MGRCITPISEKTRKTQFYRLLKTRCGDNESKMLGYYLAVANEKGFNEDFLAWYKQQRPNAPTPTFEDCPSRTIMNDVVKFYNRDNPDGNDTVMKEYKADSGNYSSVADRSFCVERVQAQLKNIYFYHHTVKRNDLNFTVDTWKDLTAKYFFNKLIDRVCQSTGLSKQELTSKFNPARRNDIGTQLMKEHGLSRDRAAAISLYAEGCKVAREVLGKDISLQNRNLIASIEDMINFNVNKDGVVARDAYFDEVFNDKDLIVITRPKDKFKEEDDNREASANAIADGENLNEGIAPDSFERDESIKEYDSHSGEFPDVMQHLSANIQMYFNSLPVCNSTRMENGVYDYDVNNPIGLSQTLNARQVTAMLLSRATRDKGIAAFVESIKTIAETTPGYEGLIKLYYDLKGYTTSSISPTGEEVSTEVPPMIAFAEELFDVFAKSIVPKKEVYIDKDGSVKTRNTNNASSPKNSFRLQCINAIQSSAPKINYGQAKTDMLKTAKALADIRQKLKDGFVIVNGAKIDYNKQSLSYATDKRNILNRIYKQLKQYYSSVTLSAVLNYTDNVLSVNLNTKVKEVDDIKNINNLLALLANTIDSSVETQKRYNEITKEAAAARLANSELQNAKEQGIEVSESSFKDLDDIYKQEYLQDSTKAAAIAVADALLPFTAVKTQYNSRNAAGNNSSDVLNNNMLTYLQHIIEHGDNTADNKESPLNKFAKYKFRSPQYDNSNILIEHKDAKGNVINLGLFRKIREYDEIADTTITRYEPTEYATELIKLSLFNGTADHVKSKAVLYANMSKGDYLVSAFASFFDNTDRTTVDGITFTDYYLRTPSDASKNFFLTMPKYSIDGLFTTSEELEVKIDETIGNYLRNIRNTDTYRGGRKTKQVNENVALQLITGENVDRIYLQEGTYKDDPETGLCYVTVQADDTRIVLSGDLVSKSKTNKYLENIEVIGVLTDDKNPIGLDNTTIAAFREYYRNKLINRENTLFDGTYAVRGVNHTHPIFRQMFAVAEQEVINAGTAINAMFEKQQRLIDGETVTCYVDKNGDIQWSETFAKSDDPHNLGEINYHRAGTGPIYIKGEDGIIRLTGKVFSSDRFTKFSDLYVDDEGHEVKNEEHNYLDGLFADGEATEEDGRIHLLYGGHNTHLHQNPDGTIQLTDAQRAFIENRIEEFINDYVDDAYKYVKQYDNLFKEDIPHNYNDVANFMLNYRLAYYACADMLEGDSKCYKNFTDFLKRAKEVQGAGVPYSALDYTRDICGNRVLLPYSSLNANTEIDNYIKEGKLHDAKAYTVFRGVTVKNTIRTSKESQGVLKNHLAEVIENSYTENGFKISKAEAKRRAEAMMKGYIGTKVNDAQSYITFEEWIRRISMRGQLPKYLPLIERILDDSKPLTVDVINEFVQVQKNFYYDMYYDKTTNHMRPRQIKNAEFVLVPRLVKGTQLEKVYNTMIEHGIDQLNTVETSKAGKSKVLTLWDNDGNLSDEWFNAPADKIQDAIEHYDYAFLYTQQETKQHVNDENKAAIQLMKRVVDNIPQYLNGKEHPLWKAKQRFYELYSQNIKESNRDLFERLNIQYDKNGNFSVSDEDGVIGLDAKVFCDLLKEELLRQAQDQDMMDYVTLNTSPVEETLTANGFGLDTKMPIIANNSVRRKFENIAQALFNNNVTRQTLPGFHAAQVTGVGYKTDDRVVYNLKDKYKDSELSEQLSYKEWKKLKAEDRVKYIPNNGVGVANDLAYHPAQFKNKNTNDIILERDYNDLSKKEKADYVQVGPATYIEVRVPKSVFNFKYTHADGSVKSDEELLIELEQAKLDQFVGYRIPTEGKQSIAIMKVVGFVDDAYGSTIIVPDDWVSQTGSDFDIDSVYSVVFNNKVNDNTGTIERIKYKKDFDESSYVSYLSRRSNSKISNRNDIKNAKKELDTAIEHYRDDKLYPLEIIEDAAKALGLPTYEEYKKLSTAEKNTREARTNELISTMLDILKSDWSLEENLSRSNFEEVIKARDKVMSAKAKGKKAARSPYDFMAQIDNMEEAISGRALKGISVAYDNLVSICNTARPTLSYKNVVTVVYPKGKYDYKTLTKRFDRPNSNDNNVTVLKNGDIEVKHTMFGWSNDNRNVAEFLITVYGSQTTAHQLDIIKEGAVPNVNDYTFGVYKLFPSIGSDYDTSIAFMAQPAITLIVDAYNRSKSIYADKYKNPIQSAVIELAKKIDPRIKYYGEANALLKDKTRIQGGINNILNYRDLEARIANTEDDVLFDYAVITTFERLKGISDKINAYGFVINPDKYGAKQSIFATNELFDKINDIVNNDNPVFNNVVNAAGNSVRFIDAIFPNISDVKEYGIDAYLQTTNDNDSLYKPLQYFMHYATVPSIVVNRRLLQTQDPNFRSIVESITTVMSGKNPKLTEDTNDSFASYIISYLHNNIDIICRPIQYHEGSPIIQLTNGSIRTETNRIYGFNQSANFRYKENGSWHDFNPIDKTTLNEADIQRFLKFSPAKKVAYVQEHFEDALACKYITANLTLHNKYDRHNPDGQSMRFNEETVDLNKVRNEFQRMFMNENPLLRLTAMDLIKYAYVVEGRSRARNTIGKMIPNSVLIKSRETKGTGIVDALKKQWDVNINYRNAETTENLIQNYVRSHPNMPEISQCTVSSSDWIKYFSGRHNIDGMVSIFDSDTTHDFLLSKGIIYEDHKHDELGESSRITIPNRYVHINHKQDGKNVDTLYRIEYGLYEHQLILIPLNKLESNEFRILSSNENNNKYMPFDFYYAFLKEWKNNNQGYTFKDYYDINATDAAKDAAKPKIPTQQQSKKIERRFDINSNAPAVSQLRDAIIDHFDGFNTKPLFIQNKALDALQLKPGIKNDKEIVQIDGTYYAIYKLPTSWLEKYIGNDRPVEKEDIFLKDIIEQIRSYNGELGDDKVRVHGVQILRAEPDEDTKFSTIIETPLSECATRATKLVNAIASTGDETAARAVRVNTSDGIEADTKSVKEHLETALLNTSEWIKEEVELLINGNENRPGFNMFWNDPDSGHFLKMTDPKVFAEMLDNPLVHRSYLKLYLDAVRLIDTFETFDYAKYGDDEAHLQYYVDAIKKELSRLKENPIFKEAERLYVTEHLAKVSNNPNVQQNIISLLDGYHKTSFLTANVNDLQDTSNPIIQIITKDVMADIRAKEMQAEAQVRKFDAEVKELLAKAKQAGKPIDFDKLIDKSGKWIDEFNENLRTDLSNKRAAIASTYAEYSKSTGNSYEKAQLFEKYLEAKYDYNKWLLKNINRAIEDDYYYKLLKNQDTLRKPDGHFIEAYVEFEMLLDRKKSLLSQSDADGSIDPAIDKEVKAIDRAIKDIISLEFFDEYGDILTKTNPDNLTGDLEKDRRRLINSYNQAEFLSDYLYHKAMIQDEYIEHKQKDSFADLLNRYLEIIERYEDRDPITNTPRRSETDLAGIEEYVRAKDWIRKNAAFRYGISREEAQNLTGVECNNYLEKYLSGKITEKSEDFKYVLAAAARYFRNKRGEKANPHAKYKRLAEERGARDANGVIDGRKFTTEDLKAIREEELQRLGLAGDSVTEKGIIHNSSDDDVFYTKAFYLKMRMDGVNTVQYQKIIERINSILRKAYVVETGKVKSAYKLSESDLEALVEELKLLGYDPNEQEYTEDAIKKKVGGSRMRAKQVAIFMKNNVEFVLSESDKADFEAQKAHAQSRGESYYNLWCTVNQEWDAEHEMFVPNHLFWGNARPKEKVLEKYTDKYKTAAVRATKYAYNAIPSKYYEMEQARVLKEYGMNSTEYKEWYELNHVYNPNTHVFEPLPCWTIHSVNDNIAGKWVPTYDMTTRSVKKGHENKNYKDGVGHISNYKGKNQRTVNDNNNQKFVDATIPNGEYDSNLTLNEHELALKKLFQETLSKLAKTQSSRRYFAHGNLPAFAVNEEETKHAWLNEIAKTFGLVDSNRKIYWNGDSSISYNTDYVPPMPGMGLLKTKDTVEPPVRDKYDTEEAYNKAVADYEEHKVEIEKKNQDIHNKLLNRDWVEVMKEFMRQAAHYNAIQDNKYALYFGQKLLEDIEVYETRSDTHNKLRKSGVLANENEPKYKKSTDENLRKQYDNWLHRVIYNHYKQSQGLGEKIGNLLQGFTSTSYMTLNLRAGIANVLVGNASIAGEAFAREYFGFKPWAIGIKLWGTSLLDYIYHAYDDKADTKVGAIIKGIQIIDYSELNGRITQLDLKKWSQIVTDLGFSTNNAGEHLMQNGAMLAMMLSHKVIENPNYGQKGEKEYIVVNFEEYTQRIREEVFREVATAEQIEAYDKWVSNIKKDPNGAKNFAWYREDPISQFIVNNLTKAQRKEFSDKVTKRKDAVKKEFDAAKTLFDQLDKDDAGYMTFAKGSIFEKLNTVVNKDGLSNAYELLGEFKGRVISVNKKIHGNYGKLDSAQIEKYYLGRLVTQYHKHLPTGIAKRWRREGYYNEERGTIEKGMYVSLYDFLTFPVKAMRKKGELTDSEAKGLVSLQNLFSNIADYGNYLLAYREIMPDYEKANLRRMLGNACGTLFAVAGALLLKLGWDDDDDDNIAKNLLLYEMDRLASECAMYTPYGMFSEFKKQWSSPVAAISIVNDAMKIMGTIAGIIFEGEDYDPYYHNGHYANRHKLAVYFERRIPYYRNYAAIRDIADNNHYYKIGDNMLSLINVEAIANYLKE